jgi:hypothetical protein
VASDSGYTIHCQKLPAGDRFGVKVITAYIPDFATTDHKEHRTIFDSDYCFRVNLHDNASNIETSKWLAHSKSAEVFESICGPRRLPTYVEMSGSYVAKSRKRYMSMTRKPIADLIRDSVPKIRERQQAAPHRP